MGVIREVKAGSTILEEEPFVYVLSSKFRSDCCDFCFKRGLLSKCSACKYVYYCNKNCQKDAWSIHKLECSNLKRISPKVIPDSARFLARLINKLRKGGDLIRGYYTEKKYRTYKDLMSHYPELKTDEKRLEHITSIYEVLREFLGNEMLPNSAEFMGMYGRMCVNSFNICNQELQSLGTGIYLGASVLDHSCTPNATVIFEGTTIRVRALENFSKLDWSKIFISYIDILALTKDRRAELEKTYYFRCECPKCLTPENLGEMIGAACPNKLCNSFVNMNQEKCSQCSSSISKDYKQRFEEVVDFTNKQLESMKHTTYLDVCKMCLEKHKGLLYKSHIKHVKTLDLAFESSIDFQLFEDAKSFGLELIENFYKYYGRIHPLTGLLHLKLAKIFSYQNDGPRAKEQLKNACSILQITHGADSTLYKEEVLPLLFQYSF